MRVLFVNHFPLTGSGSGVYTANLARSLAKQGDDAAIVFPENRSEYEHYEGVDLYPVFFKGEEDIPGVGQSSMNFPCFTTHPRSVFNFMDMTDEQRKEYEDKFRETIGKAIDEFKPDVVHAQHVWTLAGLSAEACEKRNIPMVVTCHGTDLMGIINEEKAGVNWGRQWADKASSYADSVITISEDSHNLARKILGEDINALCIKNGVDTGIFVQDPSVDRQTVLSELGIDKPYNHVVSFVGKLADFKGVDVLIDAIPQYETPDTVTLIAGNGELRETLEEQAQRVGAQNLVFLGNQPQSVLKDILNVADVSLVPSRREPFGLVAAEAMACGTPVIATNEGGLPDFVHDGVGVLVPVEDSEALATAVKSVITGERTFDRTAISQEAQDKHSIDKKVKDFKEAYTHAIDKMQSQGKTKIFFGEDGDAR